MGGWDGVLGEVLGWIRLGWIGLGWFGSEWNAMVMIPPCECFDSVL